MFMYASDRRKALNQLISPRTQCGRGKSISATGLRFVCYQDSSITLQLTETLPSYELLLTGCLVPPTTLRLEDRTVWCLNDDFVTNCVDSDVTYE
jgi:hypothetical protein